MQSTSDNHWIHSAWAVGIQTRLWRSDQWLKAGYHAQFLAGTEPTHTCLVNLGHFHLQGRATKEGTGQGATSVCALRLFHLSTQLPPCLCEKMVLERGEPTPPWEQRPQSLLSLHHTNNTHDDKENADNNLVSFPISN